MERVVTVHGISSAGAWQETVRFLLHPFFECTSIKYKQYRRFGPIKLVLEPWWLAISLIAASILWRLNVLHGGLRRWGAVFVIVCVGHLLAYYRRRRAFSTFMKQLNTSLIAGERPHVIAHSFGTYLTGRALKKWSALRFKRIILTGCVLSSRFNWKDLNASQRQAFVAVRNEIAMKDWVVQSAFFLQGLLPGMGHAGFRGFLGPSSIIHKTSGPFECCQRCLNGAGALVHNVVHPEFGHSDHFITNAHAEFFWLPFLWKMEPSEYQEFIDLCYEAAELEERHDDWKLAVVETELREKPWRWASGSIAQYFRLRLSDTLGGHSPEEIEDAVDRATGLLWRFVRHAAHVRSRTLLAFLAVADHEKRAHSPGFFVTTAESGELMALRPEFAALKVLWALIQDLQSE